jgi:exopolyphosphatase/guanosine-5'-triphosphate,3'-diphosphate pyrophosphatase
MSEALEPPDSRSRRYGAGQREAPHYAALDLGTNNCRLLIAAPTTRGFRIVDAYSRIVRLGEGLTAAGRLQEPAMERAMAALRVCADRVKRRNVHKVRAIATQACRMAENGPAFISRVKDETGLELEIISPKQEAQLSVAGCLNLFDRQGSKAALVVDVGGGSTELSWVDLTDGKLDQHVRRFAPQKLPIRAWLSIPVGVVTLAEHFPEDADDSHTWFRAMVDHVKARMDSFRHADSMREHFEGGSAHLVGTSGAITSLAGLHLGLKRYQRQAVDGLWMSEPECRTVADRLLTMSARQRANEPCIGPDRADLVLAGAAILQAVQELWPCHRVRVADRGLREGLLLSLMADPPPKRRRRGRGGQRFDQAAA